MQTLKIINDNVKKISETNTSRHVVRVRRSPDSFDIYAYKNWNKGEVIGGSQIRQIFYPSCSMYDYEDMPDPYAIRRLRENDCKVKMYKDDLVKSKRIEGIEDTEIKVRGTLPRRVAKTERLPVWIVEIKMPRRYVDEFSTEQVEAAEDAYVDMEDIQSAKDQSLDQAPQADPICNSVDPVSIIV